jgi:hypothetical protein
MAGGTFTSQGGVGGAAIEVYAANLQGEIAAFFTWAGGINAGSSITVDWTWEFSNDQNNIDATWAGA